MAKYLVLVVFKNKDFDATNVQLSCTVWEYNYTFIKYDDELSALNVAVKFARESGLHKEHHGLLTKVIVETKDEH